MLLAQGWKKNITNVQNPLFNVYSSQEVEKFSPFSLAGNSTRDGGVFATEKSFFPPSQHGGMFFSALTKSKRGDGPTWTLSFLHNILSGDMPCKIGLNSDRFFTFIKFWKQVQQRVATEVLERWKIPKFPFELWKLVLCSPIFHFHRWAREAQTQHPHVERNSWIISCLMKYQKFLLSD